MLRCGSSCGMERFPNCVEKGANPTPGHRLHAGMQGIHHNSAFPPQAPSHKIKFPLFSPLEDFPQGARSNVSVESRQEERGRDHGGRWPRALKSNWEGNWEGESESDFKAHGEEEDARPRAVHTETSAGGHLRQFATITIPAQLS